MKKKRSFSVNVGTSLVLMAVGTALLSFGGLLQAQTQTYYTEFDFTGGVTVSDYMAHITTTGGVAGNIQVALTNREKTDISVAFDVVDAVQIDGGVWACQDRYIEDSTGFARGFRGQGTSIPGADTLSSGESQTYTFTYNFPRYYTGNYMGCILYYERDTERDVNTASRKALLVSGHIASAEQNYTVKVYPIDRVQNTFGMADSGYLIVYEMDGHTGTNVVYTSVETDESGEGIARLIIEPGTYNIVYWGQNSLASFLSGVVVDGNAQMFDFTTGENVYGAVLDAEDGFWYQRGGHMRDPVSFVVDGMVNGADYGYIQGLLASDSDTVCLTYPGGQQVCNVSIGDSVSYGSGRQATVSNVPFIYDVDGNGVVNPLDYSTLHSWYTNSALMEDSNGQKYSINIDIYGASVGFERSYDYYISNPVNFVDTSDSGVGRGDGQFIKTSSNGSTTFSLYND